MTTTDKLMRLLDAAMRATYCSCSKVGVKGDSAVIALRAAVESLGAERDALKDYVEYDANCPCCSEMVACLDGCTFHNDCPNESAEMDAARAALKGQL